MPLPGSTAAGFVAAVARLDPGVHRRLIEVSALTDSDRRFILDALAGEADIGPICEVLLAEWDRLTVAERTGMLFVLAEALARTNRP
jgi:hypothetical protein